MKLYREMIEHQWPCGPITSHSTPGPGYRGAQGEARWVTASRWFKVMLLAFVVLQSDVRASVISIVTVLASSLTSCVTVDTRHQRRCARV